MADRPLTQKQEAFAVAFFETGIAAEAYRRAYDVAPDAKDHWIYTEAGQLLDHPEITRRLAELNEQAAKHSIYTRQKAMRELEDARILAMAKDNPAGAVAAIKGKVTLSGLDRPAKMELTGKDGGPIETKDTSAAEIMKARLDAIASRASGQPPEG